MFIKHYQEKDNPPKQKPIQRIEKQPIGVMPRRIHREHRFYDLCKAISRYFDANLEIPVEWIEEYNELLKGVK